MLQVAITPGNSFILIYHQLKDWSPLDKKSEYSGLNPMARYNAHASLDPTLNCLDFAELCQIKAVYF